MEMKYLREQDTGQIYLPVVHASAIVGLDTTGSSELLKKEIDLTNKEQYISGGTLTIYQYSKMVFMQVEILFDPYTENDNSAYKRMLDGNTVVLDIDLTDTNIKDCTMIVFDTASYDEENILSSVMDTSISYTNGYLSIRSSLKDLEYSFDENGALISTENPFILSKVVGSGFGLLI